MSDLVTSVRSRCLWIYKEKIDKSGILSKLGQSGTQGSLEHRAVWNTGQGENVTGLFPDPDQHRIVVGAAVGIGRVDCLGIEFLVVVHETRFVSIDVPDRNARHVGCE
jgi:hypothetical protein